MKHYVLYQAAGHNYVIECKDLEDAIKQREKHIKEVERTTKIADETTLKECMKKHNLKLIKINEERQKVKYYGVYKNSKFYKHKNRP